MYLLALYNYYINSLIIKLIASCGACNSLLTLTEIKFKNLKRILNTKIIYCYRIHLKKDPSDTKGI